MQEWDYEKNGSLNPALLTLGSEKKAWWKCSLNHSYEQKIIKKVKSKGCPYCTNRRVLSGFNDLATTNPEILKEWDYEKNTVLPSEIFARGDKRVWWLCAKGHSYQAMVGNRVRAHSGCPYCANKKLLKGYNDLATTNPELLKEWDYGKNKIKPDEIIAGTKLKIWWKCAICNYEWQTEAYTRLDGHGCPNCKRERIRFLNSKIKDEKDSLVNRFPEVIKVWNYEKNKDLKPEDFMYKSSRRVWWKCTSCGKEWETSICSKSHNTICRECAYKNRKEYVAKEGINDLRTTNPELLEEWNYERNEIDPRFVSRGQKTIVWWKCKNGHEWKASPLSRSKNNNQSSKCPYCSNRKILKGFNDLATTNPELLTEWDYSKNTVNPSEIYKGAHIKVHWKCQKGHSYITTIACRTRGTGCPYCAGQKVLKGFNDLETTNPELLKEWDYEKNKLKPDEITAGSGLKAWWKCSKGHEWKALICNRAKTGYGCPVCLNKVVLKGYNDLATTNPELLKEWDYEKNKLKPDEITAGGDKKVWWKCEVGHEWYAAIISRVRNHSNCPVCNSSKQTSISEKAIVYYLRKSNIDLIENYKIGRKEIDIFIPNLSIGIEYDGQYFHKNVKRDLEKNELCESNGIKLIRIREPDLPVLNSTSVDFVIDTLTSDHSHLNKVINKVLEYFNIYGIDVDIKKDFNEIYSLFQKGKKKDSIVDTSPELMEEWDYSKNEIDPKTVSKGQHIKVWWICKKCGYSWKSLVYTRTKGTGCPCCAGKKVLKGVNDLATTNPELIKKWDYEKNNQLGITPDNISAGSSKNVWWKCKNGHKYQRGVWSEKRIGKCPICKS